MRSTPLTKNFNVSKLGFGCMSLSKGIYAIAENFDENAAVEVVKTALELGITHFDTAIIYGNGQSETILGKGIKGFPREKLQIATKTGLQLTMGPGPMDYKLEMNSTPEFIRKTCLECLERLQTSYIDLFYIHRIDTKVPIEESMKEMKKLVEEGKIRHVGLSEASANTIRRAHAVHPITAVQIEWSLWTRDAEKEIIPTCRELGIGIVTYSPLGRGVLTGAIKSADDVKNDFRAMNPRFQEENLKKNLKLVEGVEAMAKEKGCSVGQLSLAWVLAQGDDVCPIPGTSRPAHLRENAKAMDVKLSAAEVQKLSSLMPPESIAGHRYGEGHETYETN